MALGQRKGRTKSRALLAVSLSDLLFSDDSAAGCSLRSCPCGSRPGSLGQRSAIRLDGNPQAMGEQPAFFPVQPWRRELLQTWPDRSVLGGPDSQSPPSPLQSEGRGRGFRGRATPGCDRDPLLWWTARILPETTCGDSRAQLIVFAQLQGNWRPSSIHFTLSPALLPY